MQLHIDQNIKRASTLPADFYQDSQIWEALKDKVFARTWQWIGDKNSIFNGPETVYPFVLHDKYLEEPLLLTNINEELRCMSNVCTHRGFLLVNHPTNVKKIRCGYHGRRFDLEGKMEFMPEFQEAEDFPRPCDHLHQLPLKQWQQFLFTNLDPAFDFSEITAELDRRVGFLPIKDFRFAPERTQEYLVHAHWALYCDNYLEGFHIPFVHKELHAILDYGAYTTECFQYLNLQIGYSDKGSISFDLPEGHPNYGENVSAFYYWIFPNLMLNFYPWGLQVNVVRPLSKDRCKVSFLPYIYDEALWQVMDAGRMTEKVEREDEFVVEAVHKGLQSRFYKNGRFSPTREKGVHHFHSLLAHFLQH